VFVTQTHAQPQDQRAVQGGEEYVDQEGCLDGSDVRNLTGQPDRRQGDQRQGLGQFTIEPPIRPVGADGHTRPFDPVELIDAKTAFFEQGFGHVEHGHLVDRVIAAGKSQQIDGAEKQKQTQTDPDRSAVFPVYTHAGCPKNEMSVANICGKPSRRFDGYASPQLWPMKTLSGGMILPQPAGGSDTSHDFWLHSSEMHPPVGMAQGRGLTSMWPRRMASWAVWPSTGSRLPSEMR